VEQPQEGRATTALFILPGEEEAGSLVGPAGDLQADRRGVPHQRAGMQVGGRRPSAAPPALKPLPQPQLQQQQRACMALPGAQQQSALLALGSSTAAGACLPAPRH
jgi:hypothetical protein